MSKMLDFYYDFGSPAAYLAWTQVPVMCAELGYEVNYRPMLLGGLFQATGNRTPVAVEAKGRWMMADLARFSKRYGVPFRMNPHFIINTLPIMRGAVWALAEGVVERYNRAMYEATWVQERNTGDAEEIACVVKEARLDAEAMAAAIQTQEIKQRLIDTTNEAFERGAFGAPTMFVNGEMHFGQDRLDFVRQAMAAAPA